MQLDGYLSAFPLRELLELATASLVNGAIEVQAPAGVYRLFFVQGTLVHASAPDAYGVEAFWPLFELKDASFRFIAGATTGERTIGEPIRGLITQAEALARQWSRIRPFIPRLDIVPALVLQAKDDHVRIFEEDWPILSAVDGARTIAEVARAAQLDALDVCVGLLRLKERGLVSLSQQRVVNVTTDRSMSNAAPDAAPPQPSSKPAARAGFFAKLLTEVPADLVKPSASLGASMVETALPPPPGEYDDILSLLRS